MDLDADDRVMFKQTICESFGLSFDELRRLTGKTDEKVNGTMEERVEQISNSVEDSFRLCYPPNGFCAQYDKLTQFVEAPIT